MSLTISTVTDDENAEHNRGGHLCTINRLLTLMISSHSQIPDFAFRRPTHCVGNSLNCLYSA